MELREQIFQNTEQKYIELNTKIDQLLIKELCQKYGIKLNLDEEYDNVMNLLFTPLRDDVIELLYKHSCQQPEMLFGFITNLLSHIEYDEGMYIYLISKFAKLYSYKKIGKKYDLNTDLGRLKFEKFTDCIDNEEIIEKITQGEYKNKCHSLIGVFHQEFPTAKVVTSLLPGRYKGNYFHSYFWTRKDFVIDISNNGIFKKDEFDNYFKPQEIITYPTSELIDRYEAIEEKSTDAKALQIALEHMKKR